MLYFTLTVNLLHLMYHQLMLHFDFYPLNNLYAIPSARRRVESLAGGVLGLLPLVAMRAGNPFMIMAGIAGLLGVLLYEIITWWIPYLTKPTQEWRERYEREFKETLRILPAVRDNPIPNLDHCLLHTLTAVALITTTIYFFINLTTI